MASKTRPVETKGEPERDDDAQLPTLRIGPAPEPAKKTAERRSEDVLRSTYGLSELSTEAIVRAVVDPTDLRIKLAAPAEYRVPGARIQYVSTNVWAPAVLPFPGNFREAERRQLPISERPQPFRPLTFPIAPTADRAELILEAESPRHVMHHLQESRGFLLRRNDLRPSIAQQGVMMPIIVAPLVIRHADGAREVAVPVAVEGSSRTASSQDLLGVGPNEPAYVFDDSRRFRQRLGELRALSLKNPDELTDPEKSKVRALMMPAHVIVGVQLDGAADFAAAIIALLGQLHVMAPKPWDDGASLDARGEAMVREWLNDGKIGQSMHDWYLGLITKSEARAHGLRSEFDQRANSLYLKIYISRNSASRGIRRVVPKPSVSWAEVADVAAELAIRPYRSNVSVGEADTSRAALQRVYRRTEFSTAPWNVTSRTPDQLLDAGLAEIATNPNAIGAAASELALMAAYWLTRHRILRRPFGAEEDGREPDNVLRAMMLSEWGLRVCHRAVIDGREGIVPRQIDRDGEIGVGPGGAVEMTHAWLREKVVVRPSEKDGSTPPPPAPPTPQQKLDDQIALFAYWLDYLSTTLDHVRAVKDYDAMTLVDRVGWPPEQANDHIEVLDRMAKDVYMWRRVAEMAIARQTTDGASTAAEPDDESPDE